jgi:(4-(4-[2-(gamma-L-glutamylamino)ethyl]phenoxymethyl)furan-2-yl)methanamine synthase
MPVIGLDIGGANLKGASASGEAISEAFEIWRAPDELVLRLLKLLSRLPRADRIAVTMTAELADCFETKRSGVASILAAVERAAGDAEVRVWSTAGDFVSPAEARDRPMQVAAANWHALATWAGRLAPHGKSLLFDIGSTTSDLIPLDDGLPSPAGLTDLGRLLAGELVYSGVRRTPVCAVAPRVPLRGRMCPLAAEWFATMFDVYLILGWIAEDPTDVGTANGRPATIDNAYDRLARAVCCDRTELSSAEVLTMATFLADCQQDQLRSALDAMRNGRDGAILTSILSGEGDFLARRVLERHPATEACCIFSLENELTAAIAVAACAYAVAVLAAERA